MSLFIGVESLALTADDRRRLSHPQTAGVILFARNYADVAQLSTLTAEIRSLAPELPIAVDHEGGRVQRFRTGFTLLPSAGEVGALYGRHPLAGCAWAYACGVITAYELRRVGIDFSFAPVLDLQDEVSEVIGDRAYHRNPATVVVLSAAFRRGLRALGMAAVGKHYPGHGRVQGDSHFLLPRELRPPEAREEDLLPFAAAVADGIEALMSAHIFLPEEGCPAGFSARCLQRLRDWGFEGAIISDDLDMAGAAFFPDVGGRVQAALDAGADVAMICNRFADMDQALAQALQLRDPARSQRRIRALRCCGVDEAVAEREYTAALACFRVSQQAVVA